MKTAVSIPDHLFTLADDLARRMDVSRSRLYAAAVAEYVAKYQHADVTARLDAVYGEQTGGLEPALRRAQRRSVAGEDW